MFFFLFFLFFAYILILLILLLTDLLKISIIHRLHKRCLFNIIIVYNLPRGTINMNVELLDPAKLKISLLEPDMKLLNITFSRLNYDDTQTRKILWSLLHDAGRITGFNYSKCRLLIEVFPSSGGGCVIYFTRLEEKNRRLRKTKPKPCRIFSFDDPNNLLFAIDALTSLQSAPQNDKYIPELKSALYRMKSKYYLSVTAPPVFADRVSCVLNEFGCFDGALPNDSFFAEHGEVVCEDVLGKFKNK